MQLHLKLSPERQGDEKSSPTFSILVQNSENRKTGSDQTDFPKPHSPAVRPVCVGVYLGEMQQLHGICRGKGWGRVIKRIAMHIILQQLMAVLVLQLGSVLAWVSTHSFKFQVNERGDDTRSLPWSHESEIRD